MQSVTPALPPGLTLLAGPQQSGKTQLALQAALAEAKGAASQKVVWLTRKGRKEELFWRVSSLLAEHAQTADDLELRREDDPERIAACGAATQFFKSGDFSLMGLDGVVTDGCRLAEAVASAGGSLIVVDTVLSVFGPKSAQPGEFAKALELFAPDLKLLALAPCPSDGMQHPSVADAETGNPERFLGSIPMYFQWEALATTVLTLEIAGPASRVIGVAKKSERADGSRLSVGDYFPLMFEQGRFEISYRDAHRLGGTETGEIPTRNLNLPADSEIVGLRPKLPGRL